MIETEGKTEGDVFFRRMPHSRTPAVQNIAAMMNNPHPNNTKYCETLMKSLSV